MHTRWDLPKTRTAALLVGGVGLIVAAFTAGRAFAVGVPTADGLTYSGQVSDVNGEPLNGLHNIQVSLWASDTATTGALCQTASLPITLVGGRLTVRLPPECTQAVKANSDIWVELMLNGAVIGRTKIGAVPYAVEAAEASNAVGPLAQQIVPTGAIMAFDLAACPTGWTELETARGRALIGVATGLARGTPVGSDSLTLTTAQLPAHAHTGTTSKGNAMFYRVVATTGTAHAGNHVNGWTGTADYLDATDANWPLADHTHAFTSDSVGSNQAIDNRQASLPVLFCKKN